MKTQQELDQIHNQLVEYINNCRSGLCGKCDEKCNELMKELLKDCEDKEKLYVAFKLALNAGAARKAKEKK
jgi:hypothetical protein